LQINADTRLPQERQNLSPIAENEAIMVRIKRLKKSPEWKSQGKKLFRSTSVAFLVCIFLSVVKLT